MFLMASWKLYLPSGKLNYFVCNWIYVITFNITFIYFKRYMEKFKSCTFLSLQLKLHLSCTVIYNITAKPYKDWTQNFLADLMHNDTSALYQKKNSANTLTNEFTILKFNFMKEYILLNITTSENTLRYYEGIL